MTRTRLWLFPGILAVGAASLVSQSRTHAQAAPVAAQAPAQAPAPPAGDFLKRPPVLPQPPEVQRQLLLLPEGYKAELVLSDPTITDPVGVTFDGNGRMYVLEMRQAKFVRVTQTGSARDGEYWAIQQVRMYEAIER